MGGDGAPAKGRGRFRKTGWCYPPESLLRAEADSGGDDDGPALVRPGASPPRSPRGAAPSGVERWPSARTPKVGGDRSAPRVDRFVLAPLLKIMRAALARRDHPRAAAAAALVLTATRGRDGEPRDDDPNARSVTVGHWTRGSRERAEYGEAEHAAIHAAIEILRETGGAPPPEAPAPDDGGGASRLGATSTSGQTHRRRLLQPPPPPNNNNKITQTAPLTRLTPEEEIRLLELARRCTKRGTDANEEDLVRVATVYDEKLNDPDRAVAELSRDERATVPPKGSKGGARRVPHSYKRLRCVALIRHRAWLRQSRFVNASAGDADEGENLRVPLNATGSTAPKGPPGGRTWSHFERVRLESLAKDAEDAIGRAEEKADETGERGDPRLASARAQIRMAAGDVVGAREVLEDLAAREDMRGCLAAQTMLADLLDEIKAASNPPERSIAENPGSERGDSDSSSDSDSDSSSDSDSDSSSSEESDDARDALLQRLGDVPDAHAMAERHLAVLAIDPKRVASILSLTRAFFEAQADEARALLHPDHVASQDAWREVSRTKRATSRAVLEALCRWAEAAPAEAAPWRALTVAITGLRWPSLDAHLKYGGGSVADPVTTELRLRTTRGEVVGGAEDIVHVFRGGGDGSRDAGRLATWRRSFIPTNVEALKAPPDTTPEGIAALASRAAAFAALFRGDDDVDAFVDKAEAAVNKALARAHGSKRARRHPERARGVCAFRARDVGSRAVVEEALLAAKRDAVAAAARRREETGDGDGGDSVLAERLEAAPSSSEFAAVSGWVHDRGLAMHPVARNEEPEKSSRVRTGGYKSKRVRLQELVDIRDGVVLRRGMKKRKGDPNAVRVLTEGERAEITRLQQAVDAEERAREERRVAKAGPRPECLDEKPVSKREVEAAVQAEASGGRAFTKAVKLLARRNALLEAQLAALKDWKRRGGDLNGHDERTLLRLDRWRSNLTIARNRAVVTRRRREVAAGMTHAVRHHATNPNRPRVGETCRRCQSQPGKRAKYCGSDCAAHGCENAPASSTFLPHRYGSISTHLILDWEPSWMQSRRRIKGKAVDGGGGVVDGGGGGGGGEIDGRVARGVRCAGCRDGQGSAATCGTRFARACCLRSLDVTVLSMPPPGPNEKARRRCDACRAAGITPRLCGTALAEPGCARRIAEGDGAGEAAKRRKTSAA